MAESSSVQSLDRAFDLLEILCHSRNGMSIGALSAETGLHKSTVHRLLASMCARGYVQRDAATSVYHAGMRLCELSGYIVENMDVIERARAPMERLGQETGETVHLVMQEEKDIVYIHKVEGVSGAIRMVSRIGMRRPLYCTGVGKAILATWPDDEVRALWQASSVQAYTSHTIVTEEAFFREINRVRRLGYSLDNEENELGVRCIAAAIPDYRGRASYALSVSAPLTRMPDERIALLRGPVLAARDEIAAALGGGMRRI
ncbi:MAG: IclR family transcriptional regulator [Eubacteriales bacterium]|nr:IclR family transcriptional regulator [Eubacteriales bacterium]